MKYKIAKIIKDGVYSGDSSWDEITLEILKAMREPTEKMLEPVTNADGFFKVSDPKQAYQTMIDAVIND